MIPSVITIEKTSQFNTLAIVRISSKGYKESACLYISHTVIKGSPGDNHFYYCSCANELSLHPTLAYLSSTESEH